MAFQCFWTTQRLPKEVVVGELICDCVQLFEATLRQRVVGFLSSLEPCQKGFRRPMFIDFAWFLHVVAWFMRPKRGALLD